MRVCKLSRATSNLLCFRASIALSNRTLSGCLEPRLASGFCTFLLVQEMAHARGTTMPQAITNRRNITYPNPLDADCIQTWKSRRIIFYKGYHLELDLLEG